MVRRKNKVKVKVGDVFQIPLPDGRFAYGRVYKDASVAIYRRVTARPLEPPISSRDFMFQVGLYSDILEQRIWPIIGVDPFAETESQWPPPAFIKDVRSGAYKIYEKGVIRPSNRAEANGLEEAAIWDSHHVIERILNESK